MLEKTEGTIKQATLSHTTHNGEFIFNKYKP